MYNHLEPLISQWRNTGEHVAVVSMLSGESMVYFCDSGMSILAEGVWEMEPQSPSNDNQEL